MYPFNGTPGTRFLASTFGTGGIPGFDDRDAQFILLFDTVGQVPSGQGIGAYRVISARVTVTVYNDEEFFYDPTFDAMDSYRADDDPEHVVDSDVGRPIEIFPVGYRDGFSLANWTETSPFNVQGDPFTNSERLRTAYSAVYSPTGVVTDVSLAVRDEIDVESMAEGQADLTPGAAVPADTTFTFELDVCDAGVQRYFNEGLNFGRMNFAVVSMHGSTWDPDIGPGDPSYPNFYTSENPLAQILGLTPTFEITVRVGSAGDYNEDGHRDFFDVQLFLNDFSNERAPADLNSDCRFDFFDVQRFLNEFSN
ncbi:MAG: hypothetical protein DYG94_05745 [Leptolyngbya sp. PLA3]|nr:MAG: hypothetical protein EDM82_04375 [Cyanobacteria bacterium CYA]MCE7968236.1 hypothetical protein [Leptolyngbya sp. PL-A3]